MDADGGGAVMRARIPSRRRARRAGFTLVELMVALTIAAVVIATIYTLVGASARNFHEQQRVGQTQLSTRLALDRLRRDIERAGLHGTPDSTLERQFGPPSARVVAVQLTHADPVSTATMGGFGTGNLVQADSLTLTGNYTTSDAFLVRGLNGTGDTAFLQVTWQGFRRAFANPDNASAINQPLFSEVFAVGRLLHITMINGNHYFVTVTGTTLVPGAIPSQAQAGVRFTPALPIGGLGVGGLGEGATIAPLTRVRYDLQPTPDLAAGSVGDVAVTGANTGLVRTETDVFDVTRQITAPRTILEWAVHFDVDAIVDTATGANPPAPAFVDDAAATAAVANAPQRVRALVVEIGARTPEQDPGLPWVPPAVGDPLATFRVFNNRPGAARVRTGRLEISLPNLVYRGLR